MRSHRIAIPIVGQFLFDNIPKKEDSEEAKKRNELIVKYVKEITKVQFSAFALLSNDLNIMGFDPEFYTLCFLIHRYSTIEEAIDLLDKTNGIWNHRYVPYYENKCFICNEKEETHKTIGRLLTYQRQMTNQEIESKLYSNKYQFQSNTMKPKEDNSHCKLCGICLDEINANEDYCLKCFHHFCSPCIKDYLINEINQKHINDIHCPQLQCETIMTKEEIFGLIDDQTKIKYATFQQKILIESNIDNVLCPYPDCDGFAKKEDQSSSILLIEEESLLIGKKNKDTNSDDLNDNRTMLQCSKGHFICSKCHQLWHEENCGEDKELKENSDAINAVLKRCPNCKIPIFKYEGCNHMTCSCQHQFCWLCMNPYTEDHYSIVNTPCYGKQFDDASTDPIQMAILNMERNHELLYMITIVFFISYLFISRLYQGRDSHPCILWFIAFGVVLVIFIFGSIVNLVIVISLTYSKSKFPNTNRFCLSCIYQVTNVILFIVFYFPGFLLSGFWFVYCISLSTFFLIYFMVDNEQNGHMENQEIIENIQ